MEGDRIILTGDNVSDVPISFPEPSENGVQSPANVGDFIERCNVVFDRRRALLEMFQTVRLQCLYLEQAYNSYTAYFDNRLSRLQQRFIVKSPEAENAHAGADMTKNFPMEMEGHPTFVNLTGGNVSDVPISFPEPSENGVQSSAHAGGGIRAILEELETLRLQRLDMHRRLTSYSADLKDRVSRMQQPFIAQSSETENAHAKADMTKRAKESVAANFLKKKGLDKTTSEERDRERKEEKGEKHLEGEEGDKVLSLP